MDGNNRINSSTYSFPSIYNASSIHLNSYDDNDEYNDTRLEVNEPSFRLIHSTSSIDLCSNDDDDGVNDNINEHLLEKSTSSNCSRENLNSLNETFQNMNIGLDLDENNLINLSNDSTKDATIGNESEIVASSASQIFFVEGAEEIYQNIGLEALKLISELPTADLRRPLLSIVTKHATRHQAKILLQRSKDVTKKEWTAARKHCRFPGAGRPVLPKPKYFRKKLNEETIADFLQWLHANDYIQNVAFGHKVVSYCNGVHTAIEAVKLTSNQRQIVRDYASEWHNNDESMPSTENNGEDSNELESRRQIEEEDMNFLETNDQCCVICPKTRTRCFREKNHEGRHRFTPKGRLGPSTIEKLLSSMTAGKIKSLTGLDDTDTATGFENFENMKALIKTLSDVGRSPDLSNTAKNLMTQVDSVAQFHKIGFPRHLGQGKILF